jgi:hypothetical protein
MANLPMQDRINTADMDVVLHWCDFKTITKDTLATYITLSPIKKDDTIKSKPTISFQSTI